MLDLRPATETLTAIVGAVRDDQLSAPTPCEKRNLADLLDHVDGLALAFTAAATKTPLPADSEAPYADGSRLGTQWRERIGGRLSALADVWGDESAWSGMTRAGGVDLSGDAAGIVALDELIVHGWDIAVASGQRFRCEPHLLAAAYDFVQPTAMQNPNGTPGLFGPPVAIAEDAPLLDRLIALTGRDPRWRAP